MNRLVAVLLGAALAAAAFGREPTFDEYRAVQESLARVHPRMRASCLKERGVDDPYYAAVRRSDSSQGLREVGRWSYGPSYDVDGRTTPSETLVALARGSGVSLLRFSRQDSLSIELLSDINAEGLMCRVKVVDTLLYVGSRGGLEVYNIADERNPVRLSWTPIPLNDFALRDSLVYTISGYWTDGGDDDSFRIYNVSNPTSPVFRGACRDSGYLVSVAGNAAFLGDRWGLYVIDVTNPASPHRIGSWGSAVEQVEARGHLCFVTTFNPNEPGDITFHILDVAVPSLPYQIGSLDSAGGNDVFLVDTLAYGAGDADFNELTVISVADSTRPRLIGSAATPGWSFGIWASGLAQETFVGCHWEGLQTYDTRNTSAPVRDTCLLGCDQSVDIHVDNGRACVANEMAGLKILDISDPVRPSTFGSYDTAGQGPSLASAVARESFAYIGWPRPKFRALDMSDPAMPIFAGTCELFGYPQDMVTRDSFVYVAEMNRFQIVNVARPREPVLVGSCVLNGYSGDLALVDTFAYLSGPQLTVVNVARPDSPRVVSTWARGVSGLDVLDTVLYAVGQNAQFWTLSISNPASPRPIDSLHLPSYDGEDVVAVGSIAYVGERVIRVIDVSDPANLRLRGAVSTPSTWTPRLVYTAPYVYACFGEGGVAIYETTHVAVAEPKQGEAEQARKGASVVRGVLLLPEASDHKSQAASLFDVSGRRVLDLHPGANDVRALAPGVYFVREAQAQAVRKVIKLK